MKLLLIDTQKLITTRQLYGFDLFVSNVKTLLEKARAKDIEVIYIRHDDGIGEELTKGTEGFEIYDEFAPWREKKYLTRDLIVLSKEPVYWNILSLKRKPS